MNDEIPCAKWEEKLALRLEDLSSSDFVALNEHLKECSACSAAQTDYRLLVARLQALPPSTMKPLPRLSAHSLFDEVKTEEIEDQESLVSTRTHIQSRHVSPNIVKILEKALSGLIVASIILAYLTLFGQPHPTSVGSSYWLPFGQPHPTSIGSSNDLSPQEYINLIVNHMTLDQKLGQMMIVQFVGPDYGLDISTMVTQYNVGSVLIFPANNNVVSKTQLKGLIQQMQSNSTIPLAVAIDQEGGTVDRLVNLDGARRSATAIGLTNDPAQATAAGVQDAKDLSSYGINLNLAPVVDVTNVYNSQMYLRTFGDNPTLVTKMAAAYLQGLQQSGKVLGTLKHFPGLGDVAADPHSSVPHLNRSLSQLEAIDWAPYRSLIQQGNVQAVMVTHEIVSAVDDTMPSSLSYKVVTGILRNQLGFNGVIMTDSLTMEGITAYYTEAQAAALAIEAGSDLLMGASTPDDVASMIAGIKQAMASGEISQQRIDDSVRRILTLKYKMGLIHIPNT